MMYCRVKISTHISSSGENDRRCSLSIETNHSVKSGTQSPDAIGSLNAAAVHISEKISDCICRHALVCAVDSEYVVTNWFFVRFVHLLQRTVLRQPTLMPLLSIPENILTSQRLEQVK